MTRLADAKWNVLNAKRINSLNENLCSNLLTKRIIGIMKISINVESRADVSDRNHLVRVHLHANSITLSRFPDHETCQQHSRRQALHNADEVDFLRTFRCRRRSSEDCSDAREVSLSLRNICESHSESARTSRAREKENNFMSNLPLNVDGSCLYLNLAVLCTFRSASCVKFFPNRFSNSLHVSVKTSFRT